LLLVIVLNQLLLLVIVLVRGREKRGGKRPVRFYRHSMLHILESRHRIIHIGHHC
jgi:hypothetical protein